MLLLSNPSAEATTRWIVPTATHAPGARGTQWRSDLTVLNPTEAPAQALVYFLPADTDNRRLTDPFYLTLPPRQQVSIEDVVDLAFRRNPASGALLVESESRDLVVTSRVYNRQPDRTYGMLVRGVRTVDALAAGEPGHLVFLSQGDLYRSNVGFAGATQAPGQVTLRLFDEAGRELRAKTYDLLPYGQTQINDIFASFGVSSLLAVARVEVKGTVPLVVYATVTDNRTGDPFAVLAQREGDAFDEALLITSAHRAGRNGSNFRTDLRVFNPSSSAGVLRLNFYPDGVTSPTPSSATIPLPEGRVVVLDDVLSSIFGRANASGALRLKADREFLAVSRTYDASTAGTAGFDLPSVPPSRLLGPGDVGRFPGLSTSGSRLNVQLVNPGPDAIELALSLRAPDGAANGRATVRLEPFTMRQINNVPAILGAEGSVGYLEVSTVSALSRGRYGALATVTDNVSNDPISIPVEVERAFPTSAGNGACVALPDPRVDRRLVYALTMPGANGTVETRFESATATQVRTSSTTRAGTMQSVETLTRTLAPLSEPFGFLGVVESVSVLFNPLSATTRLAFSPAQVERPGLFYCDGALWTIPSVTRTRSRGAEQPFISATLQANARIDGVGVAITTPAGTFSTVHIKRQLVVPPPVLVGEPVEPVTVDTWTSIADGVVVLQREQDASGNLVRELLLTSLR